MKVNLFIAAAFCFLSCVGKNQVSNSSNENHLDSLSSRQDTTINKCVSLVETVLNLPDLIRFSKLDLVKEEHSKIFVAVDGCGKIPPIAQNGKMLDVLGTDSVDVDLPVYLFQKFEIHGDSAYVLVLFTYTNATAIGSLKFDNSHWVPDKNFLIGVR
jgi:hypothetical protein